MTVPAHGPDTLAALRAAVDTLPDALSDGARDSADFDAADHAARFEAVHDALVAVLADVDGT